MVIRAMPYKDKEKQREASRAWQAEKRAEMRAIAHAAKARPCMDCGVEYPYYVMQFDHVREDKVEGISRMIRQPSKHGIDALRTEIAKCEVVCANCHALRHGDVHLSVKIQGCDPCQTGSIPVHRP